AGGRVAAVPVAGAAIGQPGRHGQVRRLIAELRQPGLLQIADQATGLHEPARIVRAQAFAARQRGPRFDPQHGAVIQPRGRRHAIQRQGDAVFQAQGPGMVDVLHVARHQPGTAGLGGEIVHAPLHGTAQPRQEGLPGRSFRTAADQECAAGRRLHGGAPDSGRRTTIGLSFRTALQGCAMVRLPDRTERTAPSYAVEVLKQAQALAAQGRDIISRGIGEPDCTAPARVLETLNRAADAGLSGYTAPAGIPALREAVSHYYETHFNARIDPSRILITAGASGALMLATLALINPGDEVLMPDPSYPANQNFIAAAGGTARLIPTDAEPRFQLRAEDIAAHWGPATRGVLIASPSNPTGTS